MPLTRCHTDSNLPRLNPASPLDKSVTLGDSDTLKLQLTTTDGKKAKRPHQAFLTLADPTTGLEESFVLSVKDSGKGKVDLVSDTVQLLNLDAC
jgi:oligosaccharyltransferase complex subunit delta (ribophorin II)